MRWLCYHPQVRAPSSQPPIAILGTGLIGGSLGLALRRAGYRGEIRGFDRGPVLSRARRRRAVDVGTEDLESACRGARIIFLALPIGAILDLLPRVAACASRGALITDAGSTKRRICAAAQTVFQKAGAKFLGGHPMAGREAGGVENARADLFEGAAWLLVSAPGEAAGARRRARPWLELLDQIGAQPLWTDPATHDSAMARLSHLPQLLSTTLACTLDERFATAAWRPLLAAAGPGARDMLRLAASPYGLWRDILLTNSDEIEAALHELQQTLEEMRSGLRGREMERLFAAAAALARRLRA